MKEIWKDIKGYEGKYQVSNKGRIKSLKRNIVCKNGMSLPIKERFMKSHYKKKGYEFLRLSKNNIYQTLYVHRLVAMAFIINTYHKPQVNHIDGDKSNNNHSNLEWCTAEENIIHSVESGLYKCPKGEERTNSILKDKDVIFIVKSDKTNRELSKIYCIDESLISKIRNGHRWKHITEGLI